MRRAAREAAPAARAVSRDGVGPLLATLLLTAPLAGAACRPAPAPATLTAEWVGQRDTARVRLAAEAEWCEGGGFLELVAGTGDTAVAIAWRVEVPAPGEVPLAPPDSAPPGPWASAALRLVGESVIFGYRSDSGGVRLDEAGTRLRGRVQARMRNLQGVDTLRLRVQFEGVPVRRAARGCPPAARGPDSGVS